MTNKVTDIKSAQKQTTLCLCITCKLSWAAHMSMTDPAPKCPTCNSRRTIIDQLFEIPLGDVIFFCTCGGKHYKICKREDETIYWMCVACGQISED